MVISRPPGGQREYWGLGVPGDTETCGKTRPIIGSHILCVDVSLIVAQDPPHLQWSKWAPLGLGTELVEAKAAKASYLLGARYREVHKSPP